MKVKKAKASVKRAKIPTIATIKNGNDGDSGENSLILNDLGNDISAFSAFRINSKLKNSDDSTIVTIPEPDAVANIDSEKTVRMGSKKRKRIGKTVRFEDQQVSRPDQLRRKKTRNRSSLGNDGNVLQKTYLGNLKEFLKYDQYDSDNNRFNLEMDMDVAILSRHPTVGANSSPLEKISCNSKRPNRKQLHKDSKLVKRNGANIDLKCSGSSGTDGNNSISDDRLLILSASQGAQTSIRFTTMPFSKLEDSSENGKQAFAWIVSPHGVDSFFRDIFEKKVYVANRNNPMYYGDLFSSATFVNVLQKNYIEYATNVNVAIYENGERSTLNGVGRVYPSQIRDHLNAQRSIQFINPQTYCDSIWHLCDVLQDFFGSFVGANTYLTPSDSAGFAPHWDDIDAFLLQIEGKKFWKVYAPLTEEDELPREASGNFSDHDMEGRKIVFNGWLEQGDLLYIPRGFIHQGRSDVQTHSLHLTVSFCRHFTYADLLEKFLPVTLSAFADKQFGLRQSLPAQYLDIILAAQQDYPLSTRLSNKLDSLIHENLARSVGALSEYASQYFESAVDMMACEYMRKALPPMLTEEEKKLSAVGGQKFDIFASQSHFPPETKLRFIRRHTQRLIFESDERCYIIHRMYNSRVSEERPETTFDLDVKFTDGYIQLLNSYPNWCKLDDLQCDSAAEKIELSKLLFENGLLLVRF